MKKRLFEEKQSYDGWEIYITLGLLMVYMIGSLQIQMDKVSLNPTATTIAICSLIVFAFMAYYTYYKLELRWTISNKSIKIRKAPMLSRTIKIPFSDIEAVQLVEGKELLPQIATNEVSFNMVVQMYNLQSKDGIRIFTKDGKMFFLGTDRAQKAAKVLSKVLKK